MKKSIFIVLILLLVCSSLYGGRRNESLNFIERNNYLLVFEFTTNADLGIQFIFSRAHKTGFFIHIRSHLGGPSKDCVYESITPYIAEEVFGDWYKGDDKYDHLYAGGVSLGMSPSVLLCLGLGFGKQVKYRNYIDRTGILGDGGSYYVIEKEDLSISPYVSMNFKIARCWVCAFSVSASPFQVGFGIGADFGLAGIGR